MNPPPDRADERGGSRPEVFRRFPLSEDDLDAIDAPAMRILEDIGTEVHSDTMLRMLDPELDALPNFRFEVKAIRERNGGHIDQQELSAETATRMENDYRGSWYAQNIGPATLGYLHDRVFRYYDDKNCHYIKAAICEHLIGQGVEVVP